MADVGTSSARARSFRPTSSHTALATAALTLVTGCSFINPYDHTPPPHLAENQAATSGEPLYAGGAQAALVYAESVRAGYFSNLRSSAAIRAVSAVAATSLTVKALYTGFKPGPTADGDKRMLAKVGAGLAGLYGLREFFVNDEQEAAYVEG